MKLFKDIYANKYLFYYNDYTLTCVAPAGDTVGWSLRSNSPELIREQEKRFIFI